jgi:hypothetical protein
MVATIPVQDLQQNALKYVSEAAQGAEFVITNQGRPTGVTLAKHDGTQPKGATLEELQGLWDTPVSSQGREDLIQFVEARRDAAGNIGDRNAA